MHNDLHPGNIGYILEEDKFQVKMFDFGLARLEINGTIIIPKYTRTERNESDRYESHYDFICFIGAILIPYEIYPLSIKFNQLLGLDAICQLLGIIFHSDCNLKVDIGKLKEEIYD